MKVLKATAILTIVVGAVYIALFFYEPSQTVSEHVRDTKVSLMQAMPDTQTPALSPLEEARQELERATERLAKEEARLLLEIDNATSTASQEIKALEQQIASIEARRDTTVAGLEAQIGEINATRADF